jgi:hypothetical protein
MDVASMIVVAAPLLLLRMTPDLTTIGKLSPRATPGQQGGT